MRTLGALVMTVALLTGSAATVAGQEPNGPIPTEELLSGMVTEEVEPGVLRVVNDGVRDLRSGHSDQGAYDIVAGQDGSVWHFDWPDRSLRLGEEAEYGWGGSSPDHTVEVTSDGTLWRVDPAGSIDSFDGRAWTEQTPANRSEDAWSPPTLKVGPDDTIWAVTRGGATDCPVTQRAEGMCTVLISLDDDGPGTPSRGWSDIYDGPVADNQLAVSPDGEVWLMGVGETQASADVQVLLRYDGQEWQAVEVPDDLRVVEGQSLDIGADGTLWAAVGNPSKEGDGLARLDDSGWTVFTEADGVRPWGTYGFVPTDHLHVAHDGSVWVNAEGDDSSCGGVGHFDGATWTGYLADLCFHDLDIAPDGTVWVRASAYSVSGFEFRDPPDTYVITPWAVDTYVITPEAVTAAE